MTPFMPLGRKRNLFSYTMSSVTREHAGLSIAIYLGERGGLAILLTKERKRALGLPKELLGEGRAYLSPTLPTGRQEWKAGKLTTLWS
jgi:hypothetical protein